MTDREESFEVGERPRVEIRLGSARVRISKSDAPRIDVRITGSNTDRVMIDHFGDDIRIGEDRNRRGRGSYRVALRVPPSATVQVKLGTGSVEVQNEVAELEFAGGSGDVNITKVASDASVKTASGDLNVDTVGGRARLVAASGDIELSHGMGDVSCSSASGDIRIGEAHGQVDLKTASGNAVVGLLLGDLLRAKSVSGDLEVGLPPGRTVTVQLNTLSGRVELPEAKSEITEAHSPTVKITARTVSGDIRIVRKELG